MIVLKKCISPLVWGSLLMGLSVFSVQADHHGKGHGHEGSSGESKKPCKMMKGNMPEFADLDLDGNGGINETEFNQFHAARMSEMAAEGRKMKHRAENMPGFAGIDTNGDAAISEDEFAAHQAEHRHHMKKGKHAETP